MKIVKTFSPSDSYSQFFILNFPFPRAAVHAEMLADAGLDRLAWHLVAEQPFKHPRARHQRGQVYAGLNAHLMQHMDKVLAADVARRAGRERAAADPAGARVEALDAG